MFPYDCYVSSRLNEEGLSLMGIILQSAGLLADENKRLKFSGDLLQLGKQTIGFSESEFAKFLDIWDLNVPRQKDVRSKYENIDSDLFFRAFNFSKIDSVDISDCDGANMIHDLNREVPTAWKQQYDVIFDGGTVEHVFHIKQSLDSIVAMLKPGGRIIHYCVSSNNLGHSFYMFSPTLLNDFYSANGFDVNYCYVLLYSIFQNGERSAYKILRYDEWKAVAYGEHFWQKAELFFVATKRETLNEPVVPIQRVYDPNIPSQGQVASLSQVGPVASLIRYLKSILPISIFRGMTYCRNRMTYLPRFFLCDRVGYIPVGKISTNGKIYWNHSFRSKS